MTVLRRLLVVGSYPPIPLPSSAATLEAVIRGWDDGYEVTVVSHRSGAADLSVPVIGPLAGHRLDRVRRQSGATRLVMVVEAGAPVPAGARTWQRLCAHELARSLRRFDHVTLVAAGDPWMDPRAWELLEGSADEVAARPLVGSPPPGVTVAGPAEHSLGDRASSMAARAARKVLGARAPAARAALVRFKRSLTDALHRM